MVDDIIQQAVSFAGGHNEPMISPRFSENVRPLSSCQLPHTKLRLLTSLLLSFDILSDTVDNFQNFW